MSSWTYVVGSICVDTYSENAIEDVKDFLKKAPKITGSERDVDIFLNQPSGHNSSCSEPDEKGELVWKRWETRVILTLFGTLRDRTLEKTEREVERFISELEKRFDIDYESVKVTQ